MNILGRAVACALAAVILAACSHAPKQAGTPASAAQRRVPAGASAKLYGAAVLGAKESLRPVQTFASEVGQKPRVVATYYGWGELPSVPVLRATSRYGAMPLLNLNSDTVPLPDIIGGAEDGYLKKLGHHLAKVRTPVAVSFDSEMNGPWYPWGYRHVAASTFVAAYQHVHDALRAFGARNVIWVWTPNITEGGTEQIRPLWPGSSYVNWVGLHGYFGTPAATFTRQFQPTLTSIRRITQDPVLISETGIAPGRSRPGQIRNLISGVASTQGVIGFVWFDFNKRRDWQIDRDSSALHAFRQALSSSAWREAYAVFRPKPPPAMS